MPADDPTTIHSDSATPDHKMLLSAMKYADNGWNIFPLHSILDGACTCRMKCTSPGKHPLTPHGLKDATTDEDQIKSWWTSWPWANIGIATGEASDLWVIDIDNKKSVEIGNSLVGLGSYSIRELEDEFGALPETRTVETGGGGYHYYFSWDKSCGGNRAGIRPGVDVRGGGGYVVAPPSLHLSGRPYTWGNEDILPSRPPKWIVEVASAPDVVVEEIPDDGVVIEGGRNQYLHKLGAKYRREQGYREFQIFGLLMAHNIKQCKPPLDVDEVGRIAANCATYEYTPPLDLSQWQSSQDGIPEIPDGGDVALSLFDLVNNPPTPPEPLVHGLINAGTGVLMAGQPNVGKSWVVMDMAMAVATGGQWLDEYGSEAGTVLMIDEEGTLYGQYERFQMLLDGRGSLSSVGVPLYVAIGTGMRLDSDVGITRVRRMLERYRPRLVVIDSLVRMHGGDENNAQQMSKFFEITKTLMRTYDCTFLFTHHVRKPSLDSSDPGDLIRGTTEIRAWPDTIFVLTPGEDNQEVIFHHVKARWGKRCSPFRVRMQIDDEDKVAKLAYMGEVEPNDRSVVATQNKLLRAISDLVETGEDATLAAIADKIQRSTRTTRDHLAGLVRNGAVDALEMRVAGRTSIVYRIKGT